MDTDFLQALSGYGIAYNTALTDMYKDLAAFCPDSPAIRQASMPGMVSTGPSSITLQLLTSTTSPSPMSR